MKCAECGIDAVTGVTDHLKFYCHDCSVALNLIQHVVKEHGNKIMISIMITYDMKEERFKFACTHKLDDEQIVAITECFVEALQEEGSRESTGH